MTQFPHGQATVLCCVSLSTWVWGSKVQTPTRHGAKSRLHPEQQPDAGRASVYVKVVRGAWHGSASGFDPLTTDEWGPGQRAAEELGAPSHPQRLAPGSKDSAESRPKAQPLSLASPAPCLLWHPPTQPPSLEGPGSSLSMTPSPPHLPHSESRGSAGAPQPESREESDAWPQG